VGAFVGTFVSVGRVILSDAVGSVLVTVPEGRVIVEVTVEDGRVTETTRVSVSSTVAVSVPVFVALIVSVIVLLSVYVGRVSVTVEVGSVAVIWKVSVSVSVSVGSESVCDKESVADGSEWDIVTVLLDAAPPQASASTAIALIPIPRSIPSLSALQKMPGVYST